MNKTISDHCQIQCNSETALKAAAASLARSFRLLPIDIFFQGALGAGKTTFIQSFASALNVPGQLTSPTFALEQRYKTANDVSFTHIDLYRLSEKQAEEFLSESDEHTGIRCIEWSERLSAERIKHGITISIEETSPSSRSVSVHFKDLPLPTDEQIALWQQQMLLPEHIAAHCSAVAAMSTSLSNELLQHGVIHREEAVRRAALVHDLLRFVDFNHEKTWNGYPDVSKQEQKKWSEIRKIFPGQSHEIAAATFLQQEGFEGLAYIVATHGPRTEAVSQYKQDTLEQKLLYYADKRVRFTEAVTLEERFSDLIERYGDEEYWKKELEKARGIEAELFSK